MRKTIILVSLFLIVGALSGCIGDGAEPTPVDTGTDSTDQTGTDGNDTLDETPPPANALPVPTLEASALNGTVPITVEFAMNGTDSDGMFFQWTLDADGDGTIDTEGQDLPATFEFTFDAAGDYTAVFNLSDGEDSAETTLDLSFTEPPVQPIPDAIVFEGTITGIDDHTSYATGESSYVGGGAVNLTFNHTVPVNNVTVTMDEAGTTALDLDWELVGPDGNTVWSTGAFNDPTGGTVAESDPVGFVGNHTEEPLYITADYLDVFGEYTIVLKPYTSVEGDYKITVTFS